MGKRRTRVCDAVDCTGHINLAIFARELHGKLVPRKRRIQEGSIAIIEVLREQKPSTRDGERSHFLVGLVHVPIKVKRGVRKSKSTSMSGCVDERPGN